MASRNYMTMKPSAVIPIAQRLRMTAESDSRLSLDDAFKRHCEDHHSAVESVAAYFGEKVSQSLHSKGYRGKDVKEKSAMELACKLEVYEKICSSKVNPELLLNHMRSKLHDAEALYHFRRAYAGHLASNSLLQHVFAVVPRNPSRVAFHERNGHVLSPEFRFSYNNQGFLENQKVPFRMTPNLRELLGTVMLQGRFLPGMTTVATAVKTSMEDIDASLRLLLRDDLVAWYTSKSMAKSDGKTQELEKQLSDRVTKNVLQIQSKFGECSIRKEVAKDKSLSSVPVDQKVRDLLHEASGNETLCMMPPTFHPWL
eukprot:CAMPEP_0116870060 /NCGR_PEP_ID=MMETSP0418-20121206/28092_1 /TAXON_ID=1158023 /ORGANISM="Astrosyne radiata, Strain 13vi08-1A" /LENGTH=312 /DNA_ID=CAMNT_0004506199 /DNA_START=160 /DNA_END=1098 /DNA_ORIENTATION=-